MKILNILIAAILALSFAPSSSYAFNLASERVYDFNNDSQINGLDWIQMSMYDKYELIVSYHNYSFKAMPISDNFREREISKIITVLNYYYKSNNDENRKISVWDTYQLMVE